MEEQRFVWIYEILQKLKRPINPLPPLRNTMDYLQTLVRGMLDISGENVLSGVYLLGMFACLVWYVNV